MAESVDNYTTPYSKRKIEDTNWSPNSEELDQKQAKIGLISGEQEIVMEDEIEKIISARFDVFKAALIKDVKDELLKRIETLETKVESLETANKSLKTQIETHTTNTNEVDIKKITRRMVEMEQYSRKANLKIYGLEENTGDGDRDREAGAPGPAIEEDTQAVVLTMLKDNLGVTIDPGEVVAVHRLPTNRNMARPIIIKFVRREPRSVILANRKKLKGKKISIQEDLCRDMQLVFNRVYKDARAVKSWTINGRVFFTVPGGKKHELCYGETIEEALGRT